MPSTVHQHAPSPQLLPFYDLFCALDPVPDGWLFCAWCRFWNAIPCWSCGGES